MDRAIQLARRGDNRTKMNPRVGAVIVYRDRIIGEGWHAEFGQAHAEIKALESISAADRPFISSSTIYVTLEPCSFVGKSPSCAHRLIKEGVKKVVIGAIDPNPKVNGGGCKALKQAGVELVIAVRKKECEQLLLPFSIQQEQKRPYVHLKWAESYDGYMTKKGQQTPISHPYLKFITHRIRGNCQGIMVGTDTLFIDNPRLDNRLGMGDSPVKIIMDRKGRLQNKHWEFLLSQGATLGLGPERHLLKSHFDVYIDVEPEMGLNDMLMKLYAHGIGTLMVEGGAKLIKSFITNNLWDKASIIKSPVQLHEGVKAPFLKGHLISTASIANHLVSEIAPERLSQYY
jgi:diaminohydroxyphosphoribosylaminopyrimidine deaminase/5-amino-6-(5-phosphoribosylamino)uracil reductase